MGCEQGTVTLRYMLRITADTLIFVTVTKRGTDQDVPFFRFSQNAQNLKTRTTELPTADIVGFVTVTK